MSTIALLTADEIAQFPKEKRGELVRGEWRPMNPPGFGHGEITLAIGSALRAWVKARGLGVVTVESGYVLERAPDTVLGLDVAFVRTERVPPLDAYAQFGPGAPDLAVEVGSPSQSWRSIAEKVPLYLGAGTHLVWVVHPQRRTVTVFSRDAEPRTLSTAGVLDGGEVLPGFTLPVAAVFA